MSQEQIVRSLDPFRKFLEVAAQCNGKILSTSKIAIDCNVSDKTVKQYYGILEDTLLGFFLEPFHHSFRKRLRSKPKFYFFDIGVSRALARSLSMSPAQGTSYFGEVFEQFIVVEIEKLCRLYLPDTRLSYLETEGGLEIDLVMEQPGKPLIFIEIKSTEEIIDSHLNALKLTQGSFKKDIFICVSRDLQQRRSSSGIQLLPWIKMLEAIKNQTFPFV